MVLHYAYAGGQYTPALNCNVLNCATHGGVENVAISECRTVAGAHTALKAI